METLNQNDDSDRNDDDCYFDAHDEFQFHDCSIIDKSNQSTSDYTICDKLPENSYPAVTTTTIRRRRGLKESNSESSCIGSDITQINDSKASYSNDKEKKRYKLYRDLKENEKNLDTTEPTRWNRDRVDSLGVGSEAGDDNKKVESIRNVDGDERVDESTTGDANVLEFLADLVIKAIGFQFNLLINFIMFPAWSLYSLYMLLVDPFGVTRRCRRCLMHKLVSLWNLISGLISPFVIDWLKEQKSIWNFLLRFGWGIFWSCYVGVVLCGLLVSSVMAAGLLMRCLVESPVEIKDELNFDYTQNSPVAFVPIMSCGGVDCGAPCAENSLGPRVVPFNHKLQANVLLTLPESGYNRNLGIFQVRMDFLSADGKILASKRQPCMLKFKSEPLHVLLTFFKVAPLVTGYMSESQTVKVKLRGFTEGNVPTSCIKVIIEPRAEYRPGAGIPEIYDAFVILESELPLFKRLIWSWKKTMFVWISMMLFIMQLLFMLLCCRPLIIPKTRSRDVPAVSNSLQTISQN